MNEVNVGYFEWVRWDKHWDWSFLWVMGCLWLVWGHFELWLCKGGKEYLRLDECGLKMMSGELEGS